MRIVFVPADTGGCMYYRCWVPGQELRRRGHDVRFARLLSDPAIHAADVVVFQRQCYPPAFDLLKSIQSRGGLVFHEFDDNFHEIPTENPHSVYYNDSPMTRALEKFTIAADGVIVSTPDLQAEYSRFNREIFVCYNALPDSYFGRLASGTITGQPRRSGEIRIGYAGGDSHVGDFAMVAPALTRLLADFPEARLVFVGANHRKVIPEELWDQTEFLGGVGSAANLPFDDPTAVGSTERGLAVIQYYGIMPSAELDIGIAPITAAKFNRCKSYLKVAEYGAFGIPAVASATGPYVQYQAEAGEPVIAMAKSPDDWYRALRELIVSSELRKRLALSNRRYVAASHLISRRVQAWEDTFVAAARVANLDGEPRARWEVSSAAGHS